jgi:hypothetical protein
MSLNQGGSMKRQHRKGARIGGLLLAALGVVAVLGSLPGIAAAKDRNHDRIPDRWEKRHHLSLAVNQARRDQDRDHLGNLGEFKAGDNPRNPDTNGNGVMDGEENAGTIQSFDPETGKLVIALFGGETVTGIVNEETRIRCGHECDQGEADETASGASASQDGQESGDDNSGPGNENTGPQGQGDDENTGPQGQENDENDDAPGHDGTSPGASEGPGNGDENDATCTTAALTVGATVQEADLHLENGVATFEEIDLAK